MIKIISLTKKIAIASRLFDTNLNFAEDSIFRLKIAYNGIVNVNYSDYVAVRVIHDSNNEPNITKWDLYKKYTVLFNYFIEWKIDKSMLRNVIKRRIYYFLKCYSTRNYFLKSIYILRLIISDPRILLYYINF